ncbi:hypothetical protein EHW64_13725 [Erwinia psidii]|uniref:DUF7448 domain-containing protein n=1 Tax=Erwinia psidii TaxID=69224 RepID=UPI00226BB88F|nr:hypothetical protein [Erwinia psidii]MCX8962162.1 hypothetical protein [Erwinia psidii]
MSVTIIKEMLGQTFCYVEDDRNENKLKFEISGLHYFLFHHEQDCCESVVIGDIDGDLEDLTGSPITMAEVVTESGDDGNGGSHTWTFFKFATAKGSVTVRWIGESNGYYSESVSLRIVQELTF